MSSVRPRRSAKGTTKDNVYESNSTNPGLARNQKNKTSYTSAALMSHVQFDQYLYVAVPALVPVALVVLFHRFAALPADDS